MPCLAEAIALRLTALNEVRTETPHQLPFAADEAFTAKGSLQGTPGKLTLSAISGVSSFSSIAAICPYRIDPVKSRSTVP